MDQCLGSPDARDRTEDERLATSEPKPASSSARTVAGAILLLVAAASSAMLVASHLGGIGLPGCAAVGGCADASRSVLGSVPFLGLPTASVGLAYFLAVLAGYVGTRGRPGAAARWVARIGALASIGFLIGSAALHLLCWYCIASHLANLAFLVVLETTPRTGVRRSAGFWPALATFLLASGALGIAETGARSRAREKQEKDLRESTQEVIRQSARQPDTSASESPSTDTTPARDPIPETTTNAAANMSSSTPTGTPDTEPTTPTETTPAFTGRYRIGPEVAPVRIVIFSDYQCPECKLMERQALDVLAKHPEVSLSAKHFPFCTDCNRHMPPGNNKHPNACRAALAAEAAGKIGGNDAFWAIHKWNFEVNGVFTPQELEAKVASLGLDAAAFRAAFTDPATNALVVGDVEEGMALGLRFTPTVYINGVELRGVVATDALLRAVEAVLSTNPTPQPPTADRPPNLLQKVVEDWRAEPQNREPTDQRAWSVGPEAAPLHLMMWGDYSEPFTAKADAVARSLVASRTDLRYTFRHYPVDKSCNMFARQTMFPYSCAASRAVEAAGQLGGSEAYWSFHEWALANQVQPGGAPPGGQPLTEQRLLAHAVEMGFDQTAFLAAMRGKDVKAAIDEDGRGGARVNVQSLPTLVLNGRKIPRWFVGEDVVLERIIEAAAKDADAATPSAPATPPAGGN